MEIQTIQRNIHISPRKLRLVASLVRPLKPNAALQTLQFTRKDAAKDLAKAIKTVMANARMQNLDASTMSFKKLEINEGPTMKRFRAGTRGRVKHYTKRTSEIKIVLTDVEATK